MKRTAFCERFVELTADRQARLVAALVSELTMVGRATYEPGSEQLLDPTKLRRVNEAIHRLSGQLSDLLDGRPGRYPNEAFANVICDQFEILGLALPEEPVS